MEKNQKLKNKDFINHIEGALVRGFLNKFPRYDENKEKFGGETNYVHLDYFNKYIKIFKLCYNDYLNKNLQNERNKRNIIIGFNSIILKDLIYKFMYNNNYDISFIFYYIELLQPEIINTTVDLIVNLGKEYLNFKKL